MGRVFLHGVMDQAHDGVAVIASLLAFKYETVARLRGAGLRGIALEIAENLIGYPVVDVATAKTMTGKSFESANQAIARLVEHNVLWEVTGRPIHRLFACSPVLRIINRR